MHDSRPSGRGELCSRRRSSSAGGGLHDRPADFEELLVLSEPYYFDGSGYMETVFSYRLPKEWALVP